MKPSSAPVTRSRLTFLRREVSADISGNRVSSGDHAKYSSAKPELASILKTSKRVAKEAKEVKALTKLTHENLKLLDLEAKRAHHLP